MTAPLKELNEDQQAALNLFKQLDADTAPLTDAQVAVLRHLSAEVIAFDDVERLKQFARDTATINPRLLAEVESGAVRPCPMLTALMDAYYGAKVEGAAA